MFAYVIVSEVRGLRFYVGMSDDVERRLAEHNKGYTFSTKGYRPWSLFFKEKYLNQTEARKREKFLKGGSGKEYIKDKWSRSSVG